MSQIKTVEEGWEAYKKSFNCDTQTLKAAFLAGVKWATKESLYTLQDYATACEGLPAEHITPSQRYDLVSANLSEYYQEIGAFK